MVRRIIWSKNALKDKVQILDYWYKRIGTKTYSLKLDKQLRHAVKILDKHPDLGRKIENTEIRFVVKDYYQIFYKYTKTTSEFYTFGIAEETPKTLS